MSLQSALALHGLWWLCFRSVTSKAHFLPIDENQLEWMFTAMHGNTWPRCKWSALQYYIHMIDFHETLAIDVKYTKRICKAFAERYSGTPYCSAAKELFLYKT
jgi:hypothetical protein